MIALPVSGIKSIESVGNYGRFVIEPLQVGFSVTVGNAMRRVMLSSLSGAAVTWIKVEGIQHEFSAIPCIREDMLDFLMNVKEIRLRPLTHDPGKLCLDVKGEGEVCAADITPSSNFEIVNPELHLATLDSVGASLSVEFNVEVGRGYMPAFPTEGLPVGALPVDAVFSPVHKVNFLVEAIQPGREGSPERLVFEVWTDGTIAPEEAIRQGAVILTEQLMPLKDLKNQAEGWQEAGQETDALALTNMSLEEMGMGTRAYNSLRRGGVTTLGQLLEIMQDVGLPSLPGMGAKSQDEVKEIVARMGFTVGSKGKKKEKDETSGSGQET